MRSLMIAAALVFSTSGSLARGAFNFGNKNLVATPPIDAKVFLADGVTPAAGTNYWAQAYIKLASDPDSSYAPIGNAVHFRTGNNAGYIAQQTITTSFPGGTVVNVEMRVWQADLGATYEAAVATADSCPCAWKLMPVTLTLNAAPAVPADMTGLSPISWTWGCFGVGGRITREPSGSRIAVGGVVSLEMRVTNRCYVTIRWYRDNQPVAWATETTLRIPQAQLADTGDYYATIEGANPPWLGGALTSTSQVARVVVGYPLSVAANGPGWIQVQPPFEVFEPGARVELTAVPADGAAFDRWEGDLSGTLNPAALTMDGPKTVQAWFAWVPMLLNISRQQDQVRIEWTMPAVLQASDALVPGDWQDVSDAASPYDVEPANIQRFYRLRRPRRTRRGETGSGPREAPGVRRFTGALLRSGNTMVTQIGPSHPSHADWDRLACQPRSGPTLDLVRQANGLRHRSRGQRPRATADLVHVLTGRTNLRPAGVEARLSGPLQGAERLEDTGSEGEALGYDGGRLSGGESAARTEYDHVRGHRPRPQAKSGRQTMRSLILTAAVAVSACDALAQGRFIFGNRCDTCTPPVDAKVFDKDCTTTLSGMAYSAQAYIKPAGDPDSSYRPVGEPVSFKTGNDAGYIESVEVITPFPADTQIVLELRAWERTGGDSYEAAIYAGKLAVKSNGLTLRVTVPPDPAPHMVGLTSFCFAAPSPLRPSIIGQPSGVRVAVNHPWALQVSATGDAPLAYQWYRDGQALIGENEEILNATNARFVDTGDYCVVVTNPGGHTKSHVARVVVGYPVTLTANGPGRIKVRPPFEIFEPGERVTLTAVPSDGAAFERWEGDLSGTVNPVALTMDGPKTVQAWFAWVPMLLNISRQQDQVRIEWTMPAVLQASDALVPGDWEDLNDAATPYDVEPANAQRFYRLRRPRRVRCGKTGDGPREAPGRPPFRWRAAQVGSGRPRTAAPPMESGTMGDRAGALDPRRDSGSRQRIARSMWSAPVQRRFS